MPDIGYIIAMQLLAHRFTRGGRDNLKPILFMAAMAATRSKTELGEFYARLVKAGKKKMIALVALMRKILVTENAQLRDFLDNEHNLICPQAHQAIA